MKKLTAEIKHVVRAWLTPDAIEQVPKNIDKIKVSELVSSVATVYEKLRNAVDYKEEHLIRRHAVRRLLRRNIMLGELRPEVVSKQLLIELIRAHYLANDTYPETKIGEVAAIIDKYFSLLAYEDDKLPRKTVRAIHDWLTELAAVEIEEFLVPATKDLAITEVMYSVVNRDLVLHRIQLPPSLVQTQVYLATLRTYLKANYSILSFRLLLLYHPHWKSYTAEDIAAIAPKISQLYNNINQQINYRLSFQFDTLIRPWSVYFLILRDIISKHSENVGDLLASPEKCRSAIREACAKRYKNTARKTRLRFVHAIIYILLTKIVLAFIIELPYDLIVHGAIGVIPLAANVIFHPLLMLMIATFTRTPGAKNTDAIVKNVEGIIYGDPQRKIMFNYKKTMQPGTPSYVFFNGLYFAMFIITYGLLLGLLTRLHFNIVSGTLFVFFLTLVSFLGLRLRAITHELVVTEGRVGFFGLIFNILTIPITRVGQWLSSNFSKVNIFIYLLDYLIEAPFKLILEGLEQMVGFVRDKKEEIH